ncbi:MAG: RluA family pseudouridine synthase [Lachnospiraceae bacterium]|nr:RluA family pseudouridine synthase [Lachnospiraceae bacterium]
MILYEDKNVIVCHKPAGFPVQSARPQQMDMVSMLNNHLAEENERKVSEPKKGEKYSKNKIEEPQMIHVVHRLDQPVEGVLVFAKTKKAASELSRQVTDGRMKKVYHAVCCVDKKTEITDKLWIKDGSGEVFKAYDGKITLVDYLAKDSRTNMAFVADKNRKDAKRAELSFRILGQSENGQFLFAEIDLKTGRFHQIRVQMAHAGIPLFGDRKYNEKWEGFAEDFKETYGNVSENNSLALCAVSLTFFHPVTGKKMNFKVEPEGEIFRAFMH